MIWPVSSQAIMEEIAGFEERLTSLKDKGDHLASSCSEQVQAKISQQIQAHQQGTRDSYSAICSTAQRVSTPANIASHYQKYHLIHFSLMFNIWLIRCIRVWTVSSRSMSVIRTPCSSVRRGCPLLKKRSSCRRRLPMASKRLSNR